MTLTGPRSNTSRLAVLAACLVAFQGMSVPAHALDLFTLWQQQEVPLDLTPGSRVDYRHQVMSGGRRKTDLTRIACLPAPAGAPDGALVFEILPLTETDDGSVHPVPGQGVWLLVSGDIASRHGDLIDRVREAWQWEDGRSRPLSLDEMRQDPLAAGILHSGFVADEVRKGDPTTRIISGRQFLCDQLVLSARDTQSVNLPAGRMTQVTSHEVTAAFNPELPLLGLAYATERTSAESKFDAPNPRINAPPARIRVEVMEMIDFSRDAHSRLGRGH